MLQIKNISRLQSSEIILQELKLILIAQWQTSPLDTHISLLELVLRLLKKNCKELSPISNLPTVWNPRIFGHIGVSRLPSASSPSAELQNMTKQFQSARELSRLTKAMLEHTLNLAKPTGKTMLPIRRMKQCKNTERLYSLTPTMLKPTSSLPQYTELKTCMTVQ